MICLLCRSECEMESYDDHIRDHHASIRQERTKSCCLPFYPVENFQGVITGYRMNLSDSSDEMDVDKIFDHVQVALNRCVESFQPPLRVKVVFKCRFSKANTEGVRTIVYDDDVIFGTQACELWVPLNVPEAVTIMRD